MRLVVWKEDVPLQGGLLLPDHESHEVLLVGGLETVVGFADIKDAALHEFSPGNQNVVEIIDVVGTLAPEFTETGTSPVVLEGGVDHDPELGAEAVGLLDPVVSHKMDGVALLLP